MGWVVQLHDDFETEFHQLSKAVRVQILALTELLAELGPTLGRPRVDTLNGSRYANMKELRFDADRGVWRAAFAFDTQRCATLLAAGKKSGVSQRRFYRQLIEKADDRFARYLADLEQKRRQTCQNLQKR